MAANVPCLVYPPKLVFVNHDQVSEEE